MALYSSVSFAFCIPDSLVALEPATDVTSSFTEATWARSQMENTMPMTPVMRMRPAACIGDCSSIPPSTHSARIDDAVFMAAIRCRGRASQTRSPQDVDPSCGPVTEIATQIGISWRRYIGLLEPWSRILCSSAEKLLHSCIELGVPMRNYLNHSVSLRSGRRYITRTV